MITTTTSTTAPTQPPPAPSPSPATSPPPRTPQPDDEIDVEHGGTGRYFRGTVVRIENDQQQHHCSSSSSFSSSSTTTSTSLPKLLVHYEDGAVGFMYIGLHRWHFAHDFDLHPPYSRCCRDAMRECSDPRIAFVSRQQQQQQTPTSNHNHDGLNHRPNAHHGTPPTEHIGSGASGGTAGSFAENPNNNKSSNTDAATTTTTTTTATTTATTTTTTTVTPPSSTKRHLQTYSTARHPRPTSAPRTPKRKRTTTARPTNNHSPCTSSTPSAYQDQHAQSRKQKQGQRQALSSADWSRPAGSGGPVRKTVRSQRPSWVGGGGQLAAPIS